MKEKMDYSGASEVDVAYRILTEGGHSIHYRDLIMEVIKRKHRPVQSLPATISEIYTLINMDSRFSYAGENQWGLSEWEPQETGKTSSRRRS